MQRQVTFGHILVLIVSILIPLIIWGTTIEVRFSQVITNTEEINDLKTENKKLNIMIQQHHLEVLEVLHIIELQLKDKKDK